MGSVSGSVISSEVQADGETVTDLGRIHSQAAAPRSTRVSASAEVRFPVTTVEKMPERMVVIGDVHGDFGEAWAWWTVPVAESWLSRDLRWKTSHPEAETLQPIRHNLTSRPIRCLPYYTNR